MSEQQLTLDDPVSSIASDQLKRIDNTAQRAVYLLMTLQQRKARNLRGELDGFDDTYRTTATSAQEQRSWNAGLKAGDLVTDLGRQRLGTVVDLNPDGTIAVRYLGADQPTLEARGDLMVVHASPTPSAAPTAVVTQEQNVIGVGDEVQALDRGNIGKVAAVNSDGTIAVQFRNASTGASAEVNLDPEKLAVIRSADTTNKSRFRLGDFIEGPDGAGQVISTNASTVTLRLTDGDEISYSRSVLGSFGADTSRAASTAALADAARPSGAIRPSGKPDPDRIVKHIRRTPTPTNAPSPKTRPATWDRTRGPKPQ